MYWPKYLSLHCTALPLGNATNWKLFKMIMMIRVDLMTIIYWQVPRYIVCIQVYNAYESYARRSTKAHTWCWQWCWWCFWPAQSSCQPSVRVSAIFPACAPSPAPVIVIVICILVIIIVISMTMTIVSYDLKPPLPSTSLTAPICFESLPRRKPRLDIHHNYIGKQSPYGIHHYYHVYESGRWQMVKSITFMWGSNL